MSLLGVMMTEAELKALQEKWNERLHHAVYRNYADWFPELIGDFFQLIAYLRQQPSLDSEALNAKPLVLRFRVLPLLPERPDDLRCFILVDQDEFVWLTGGRIGKTDASFLREWRHHFALTESDAWHNAPIGVKWERAE